MRRNLVFLIIFPIFIFILITLISFILKNNAEPKFNFLWVAKTFQAYCVNSPGPSAKDIKICPLVDHYEIKNNVLIHTKIQGMNQENLYFYHFLTQKNQPINFSQAQKLMFLNQKNPTGFYLKAALPLGALIFPFNFYPEIAYSSSQNNISRVVLEKNGHQIKIQDVKNMSWDPENIVLLGWVQS